MAGRSQHDPSELAVDVADVDEVTVLVRPVGSIDLRGAPRFKLALEGLLDASRQRVLVDLSGVEFMDSTGLSVLVAFQYRLKPPRKLVLTGAGPEIQRLLEVTGLHTSFATAQGEADSVVAGPRQEARQGSASGSPPGQPGQISPQGVPGTPGPPQDPHGRLSRDAAMALAMATTAMPFAADREQEADRWLRALRHHGDSGVILGSLGVTDQIDPGAPSPPTPAAPSRAAADADPAAAVTARASQLTRERGAATTQTRDLLQAVRDTYGDAFEHALARHTRPESDALALLDQLLH